MKSIFYVIAGALGALLISCGTNASKSSAHDHAAEETTCSGNDHEGHNHEAEDTHDHAAHAEGDGHNHTEGEACESEGKITLPKTQAAALGLTFQTVERAAFSGAIRVSGTIEPAIDDNTSIVAPIAGIIKFANHNLNIGQRVTKGQKLFTIQTASLGGGNQTEQIANARAALNRAEIELKRIESLLAEKITTQSQYQEALMNRDMARNTLSALTVGTSADGSRSVVASKDGYITDFSATEGSFVEQGAVLLTISTLRELSLSVYLPQRYAAQLPTLHQMNFTVPSSSEVFTTDRLTSRARTASSGMIEIRFSVKNQAALLPGMTVEGYILTAPRADVIAIPLTALTDEQGAKYVYIRTGEETYTKQLVTTGQSNGRTIEITSGLKPGQEVVVTGPYFVKLASASTSIPHGHSH